MLQDDIKEYWGFYLLKDSTVKLSVCSRHEGASFIVVKVSRGKIFQHQNLENHLRNIEFEIFQQLIWGKTVKRTRENKFFQSLKDARRCAFLGELDSVEESDEISDEFEFSDETVDSSSEEYGKTFFDTA